MPDDAGDAVALLEKAELLDQSVVPQLLAVVGGHHHQGVVPLPGLLEMGDDPPDLLVDVRDHAEVLGPEPG